MIQTPGGSLKTYLQLLSTFTVTSKNPMKIAFGDRIFACNPRDFGIFMPKHLAGQWLLNSYIYLIILRLHGISLPVFRSSP